MFTATVFFYCCYFAFHFHPWHPFSTVKRFFLLFCCCLLLDKNRKRLLSTLIQLNGIFHCLSCWWVHNTQKNNEKSARTLVHSNRRIIFNWVFACGIKTTLKWYDVTGKWQRHIQINFILNEILLQKHFKNLFTKQERNARERRRHVNEWKKVCLLRIDEFESESIKKDNRIKRHSV